MATADWYPDPTRLGRLRYWDGFAWTDHVSEAGEVAAAPIPGAPPGPPKDPPVAGPPPREEPAPAATAAAPADTAVAEPVAEGPRLAYPPTPLGRAGLLVAAAGGLLTTATVGSTAVTQEPFNRIEVTGGAWVGTIAAVLCVAAAAVPRPWARVAGLAAAVFFAVFVGLAVVAFRTSDELIPGIDVSLARAGWMMVASVLVLFAGTAIGLVGLRRPVREPQPGASPGTGKGSAALVLGVVGLLLPFLAPPAVGLGLFALDDRRAGVVPVGGRRAALAGIALGALSLAGWCLGLLLGMLLAQP